MLHHFNSANELLVELGVTRADEIDIEAIAFYCGARVQYQTLDGCAARLIGAGESAIITVEARASIPRRRFSIAHELGHWMRDRGKTAYMCAKRDVTAMWDDAMNLETGANRFAADLLMPEHVFKPACNGRQMTLEHVRALAAIFNTSMTATAIRYVRYGPSPAMLVFHKTNGRMTFIRGPDVSDEIWPCKELSHNTEAFGILFGGKTQNRPRDVDADEWINHRHADRYSVVEDSIKISDDCVMSMIWWKDESQLSDIEE